MRKQAEDAVDERARLLFKLLVERYIADGSPVASKLLASSPEIEVSSATVRNIMAELEERGLVRSPHTSAGKVPTNLGLRFFVDSLLSVQPLDASGRPVRYQSTSFCSNDSLGSPRCTVPPLRVELSV